MHYGQQHDTVTELNKIHENVILQSNATETEAVIVEHNEIALKLDTLSIAINTSHNKLAKSLNINEDGSESNNKNTSNAFEKTVNLPNLN